MAAVPADPQPGRLLFEVEKDRLLFVQDHQVQFVLRFIDNVIHGAILLAASRQAAATPGAETRCFLYPRPLKL
jgi:hypothetical protein